MRRYCFLLIALAAFALSPAVRADDARKPAASGGLVAIEVLLADVAPSDKVEAEGDEKAIVARIRDLDKQGKLARVTRLRMTTLSEQQGMVQFGERAPLASGRTFPGGRGGAGGFAGGEGQSSTSYTFQNVGTILQITPRITEGKVILDCMVEQSRVTPKKPAAGDKLEGTFEPQGVETITAKSVVQMRSGETALLASRQLTSAEGSTRTYVLVTATFDEAAAKEASIVKIFYLVHAKASVVGEGLTTALGRTLEIAADNRTNAIVARGSAKELDVLAAILTELDKKTEPEKE